MLALLIALLVSANAVLPHAHSAGQPKAAQTMKGRDGRIPVGNADLYFREIGRGQPLIVLHGGPDFDHSYLLPDLDRLADSFRLIYYDQRGRGRSADRVRAEDVSLASDVADLEKVRQHFQLASAAVLGHSWGAVLALEYAIRNPERVSHLILMNPAPASAADFMLLRKERIEKFPAIAGRLKTMSETDGYRQGDPDAVAAYYRIHFQPALAHAGHLEQVIASLRASFTSEGILKARAIEERLMNDTWLSAAGYDLLPRLRTLRIPTLVISGDHEFIPAAAAAHIADAIPSARLVTLKDCGHFSYLECPDLLRKEIDSFFRRP